MTAQEFKCVHGMDLWIREARPPGLPIDTMRNHPSNAKKRFQSSFMLITVQALLLGPSRSDWASVRDLATRQAARGSMRVLARGVVVMDQRFQPRAAAHAGPFQHFAIAGRVADGCIGALVR